jgi:hypothetical protein
MTHRLTPLVSHSSALHSGLVMISIGIVISCYALFTSIKLYRRQSAISVSREKLYKTCLVAACSMVLVQVTSHFISDALNPLKGTYSNGVRALHVIVHCIVYRSVHLLILRFQIHFVFFILFITSIYSRFRMLENVVRYSRVLVIACDTIIYLSSAFFLALGGVIVVNMWSKCSVYDFQCFTDVRKGFMGWVFLAQVWYYAIEIVFGLFAIYNVVYKCRGPKELHGESEKGEAVHSTTRSQGSKQKYRMKVIFFLGLWSVNLTGLICVMFAYCFADFAQVASPLLHSVLR